MGLQCPHRHSRVGAAARSGRRDPRRHRRIGPRRAGRPARQVAGRVADVGRAVPRRARAGRRRRAGPPRVRRRPATSTWSCSTPGSPTWSRSRSRSGIRSGTPAIAGPFGTHLRRGGRRRRRRRQGGARPARRPARRRRRAARRRRCANGRPTSGAATPVQRCRPCGSSPDSAGRPTASWPSCSKVTSRRPAAACGTCGSCAASATPVSPTPCRPAGACRLARLLDVRDALHLAAGRRRGPAARPGPRRGRRGCSALRRRPTTRLRRRRRRARGPSRTPWTTPGGPSTRLAAPAAPGAAPGRAGTRPLARATWSSRTARSSSPGPPSPRAPIRRLVAAGGRGGRPDEPADRPADAGVAGAAFAQPLPTPWPARGPRRLFDRCSAPAPALVSTWEACDRFGLVTAWLPEWARVRSRPSTTRSTGTQWTVTWSRRAGGAARYTREVPRPDLLVLSALCCTTSARACPATTAPWARPIAAAVAARDRVCRPRTCDRSAGGPLHLLLPEVATRRDLADPVTVRDVADAVGDAETLDAAARAEPAPTPPPPVRPPGRRGRAGSIAELVDRVRGRARTPARRRAACTDPAAPLAGGPAAGRRVSPRPGRGGRRRPVRACSPRWPAAWPCTGSTWSRRTPPRTTASRRGRVRGCSPATAPAPTASVLTADLRRAVTGELRRGGPAGRARTVGPPRSGADAGPPRVVWRRRPTRPSWNCAPPTSPGLLYRVANALALAGARVRAARISTLGGDVVDAFYLVGAWDEAEQRSAIEAAVLAAAPPA